MNNKKHLKNLTFVFETLNIIIEKYTININGEFPNGKYKRRLTSFLKFRGTEHTISFY